VDKETKFHRVGGRLCDSSKKAREDRTNPCRRHGQENDLRRGSTRSTSDGPRARITIGGADTLETLLKAARVAEVAAVPETSTEPLLSQLLAAVQESRRVAQENQEELRHVTRWVEGLTVAQVSDRQIWPT
jgi:hypothetical protein